LLQILNQAALINFFQPAFPIISGRDTGLRYIPKRGTNIYYLHLFFIQNFDLMAQGHFPCLLLTCSNLDFVSLILNKTPSFSAFC